jgi:uracil-DNA glycosylase family 4
MLSHDQYPIALAQFPPRSTCTVCKLHSEARSVGIALHHLPYSLSRRPENPPLLLVGQNPGFNENQAGIPFIGKSGEVVAKAYVKGASLHLGSCAYVSNVARCYSATEPTNSHYKACRPYLLTDMQDLARFHSSPVLHVLCLGAVASSHVTALLTGSKDGMPFNSCLSIQGQLLPIPSLAGKSAKLFFTYHPAACLRTHALIYAVQDHLVLLRRHLANSAPETSLPTIVLPFSPVHPPLRAPSHDHDQPDPDQS